MNSTWFLLRGRFANAWRFLSILSLVLLFHSRPSLADEVPLKRDWSNIENIQMGIRSDFWGDRYNAVAGILTVPHFDTTWAVNTIVEAMDIEVSQPSSTERAQDNYLTFSERVQRHYMKTLLKLCPGAIPLLRQLANSFTGETKDWMMVILGFQNDEYAHIQLRDILTNRANSNLKAMAAWSISSYSDTSDIPYLLQALSEAHQVEISSDWIIPGRGAKDTVNIVGAEVGPALRKMGYDAVQDSTSGGYKVVKIK